MLNKAVRIKHRLNAACLLLITVIAGSLPASAQSGVYTPKAGSPERKAIMDALRAPVEIDVKRNASPASSGKGLKIPVIFEVPDPPTQLRVKQDWAYVYALLCHPNGKQFDYDFPVVTALLHRTQGHWHVVDHLTGDIHAPEAEWSRRYHAPPALFPKPQ